MIKKNTMWRAMISYVAKGQDTNIKIMLFLFSKIYKIITLTAPGSDVSKRSPIKITDGSQHFTSDEQRCSLVKLKHDG